MINGETIYLAEHAFSKNSVQVEGYYYRHFLADQTPGLRKKKTFRVQLAISPHGAVHGEINSVDAGVYSILDGLEHFGGKPFPTFGGKQPCRSCACGYCKNGPHSRSAKDWQGAA